MTTTGVNTATATHTVSVSAGDVRQVMRCVGADIRAVCRAAPQGACPFDVDKALVEVSVMLVSGVIKGVSLLVDVGGTIVREYEFKFVDAQGGTPGPPAGQPPLGHVPDGARLRLRAAYDMNVPEEERRAVMDQLGWVDARPLIYSKGMAETTYGSFRSGGLYVERSLKADPVYDRPRPSSGAAGAAEVPARR